MTPGREEPALANDEWLTAGSAEDAWTATDVVTKALPTASSTRARTTFGVRIVLAASNARCPGAFNETVTIARLCRRTASARYAHRVHERSPRTPSTASRGTYEPDNPSEPLKVGITGDTTKCRSEIGAPTRTVSSPSIASVRFIA